MRKLGFTLAEVLITLVIIGVIAAMTVPTLMNNTQGQENKAAYKKAISSLNQALSLEYALDGNTAASTNIADIFRKRANVLSQDANNWKSTSKPTGSNIVFITTTDGVVYAFPNTQKTTGGCPGEDTITGTSNTIYNSTSCGVGMVDVNGSKGPNKLVSSSDKPEDVFNFTIFETKVVPGKTANSVETAVMYDKKGVTGANK